MPAKTRAQVRSSDYTTLSCRVRSCPETLASSLEPWPARTTPALFHQLSLAWRYFGVFTRKQTHCVISTGLWTTQFTAFLRTSVWERRCTRSGGEWQLTGRGSLVLWSWGRSTDPCSAGRYSRRVQHRACLLTLTQIATNSCFMEWRFSSFQSSSYWFPWKADATLTSL